MNIVYPVVRREFAVAFSRRAQPRWFRTLKRAAGLLPGFLLCFTRSFWLTVMIAVGLSLHRLHGCKTRGWKQRWNEIESGCV